MTKVLRDIIRIDEEKCNGCGACVPGCKEGALQIVNGKARLVSEVYCDGLGACLGECPTGALTIEKREVESFDVAAVEEHLAIQGESSESSESSRQGERADHHGGSPLPCGCPGTMARTIERPGRAPAAALETADALSELRQWPVQLHLIPPQAPYLAGADLVLMADCTAFAYANAHRDFIRNRAIAIACPKLDDTGSYLTKLTEMIRRNRFRSLEVAIMEVPCCAGLSALAERAIEASGVSVPFIRTVISLEGEKMTS